MATWSTGLDVGKRLRHVNPAGDGVRGFDLQVQVAHGIMIHVTVHVGKKPKRLGGQVRQILKLEFLRVREEAHNVQRITRELRADQGIQRQRHFFGGGKAAKTLHRPAHIQEQHRRAPRHGFRAVHLEILRGEPQGGCAAVRSTAFITVRARWISNGSPKT